MTENPLQHLVPHPVKVTPSPGTHTLTPDTTIQATAAAREPAERLAEILRRSTGFALPVNDATGRIRFTDGAAEDQGTEGYQLDVTPDAVTIRANSPAGHFNAIATLRQLFDPRIEAQSPQRGPWQIPAVSIRDHPRYHHRGAMLDVARHFFTPAEVKRYIDQIAAYKINYFHLHLTDDQGWRLEIKSWPDLTRTGGSTEVGGRTGDLHYTQAEYEDLVEYAANRGITVIPEIDVPGHTNAAQASYPELNDDDRAKPHYTGTDVGFSSLAIHKDVTYTFVEDVIREVAALTPGPYLHIGGDEALSTSEEDYATFMTRVLPLVKKYGKTAIGWHEFIKTSDDPATIPQFWGTTTTDDDVAAAVRRGHKVLMSPANHVYLDIKYDDTTTLGLVWAGLVDVRDTYDWNPGAHLEGVSEEHVHGIEAPLWTETVTTSADVEHMAFPRLAAAAELAWAPAEVHDWEAFAPRLAAQAERWRVQGVRFHPSPQVPWPGQD
ncbi:beta-N-acetylhexosaminidase [Lentzea sp. CC55]|uniref:beta-N-acetylhexosaminidase n=1 Tax=Lentzea sp. CC55 TaxID=2884909 RepID=UPI0027E2146B|nr:beta-N-acetylhexosaminidase [Lentzea sp. CC55]MCG8926120.1 beta-N-acetylhexosaminidase [Lentzea sp. CC55]